MKYIKIILKVLGIIVLTLLLVIMGAFILDKQKTSYLNISSSPDFESNSYVIQNVNVVPMTADTVLANQMVLIENGVIAEIGSTIQEPELEVIDGENGFLTPGLIDMHVHVWDKYELGLYLANGVTTIRNLWGHPMHLRIKEEIVSEKLIGPMFFTSGPKLTGPEFIGDDNLQLFSPEEAKEKVKEYKERGYDFIKTYYGITEELFDAVLEEAQFSGMDVAAHPTPKVPYEYHFHEGINTIEHAEEFVQQPLNYELDTIKLEAIIDGYVANPHASLSPTLIVFYNIYNLLTKENVLSSGELEYMNPMIKMADSKAQFDRWSETKANDPDVIKRIKNQHDFHVYIVRQLHERGVNIVLGTDAGIGITLPGYSIHQELGFYLDAGMNNYEALKTATVNPTKTHDFLKNLGSIEVGKTANLILTKNNPLEDLKALELPELVMVRGRKINREKLDHFESKAYDRKNLLVSGLRYAENLYVEKR